MTHRTYLFHLKYFTHLSFTRMSQDNWKNSDIFRFSDATDTDINSNIIKNSKKQKIVFENECPVSDYLFSQNVDVIKRINIKEAMPEYILDCNNKNNIFNTNINNTLESIFKIDKDDTNNRSTIFDNLNKPIFGTTNDKRIDNTQHASYKSSVDGIYSNESKTSIDEHTTYLKLKDRWLPLANVSKIMKSSVPETAKVAKDAKALVQQAASEFIAIVTCKAKDIAASESRKAITGDDLIKAMDELDLSNFAQITSKYFDQYKKTTNSYAIIYFNQNNKYFE